MCEVSIQHHDVPVLCRQFSQGFSVGHSGLVVLVVLPDISVSVTLNKQVLQAQHLVRGLLYRIALE